MRAVIVGRPKAWEFDKQKLPEERVAYRAEQRETIVRAVRDYNKAIPIVQNLDIGHTNPQIALPYGRKVRIEVPTKKIFAEF